MTTPRSDGSAEFEARARDLQDAVNAMVGRAERVMWGDPVVPTAEARAGGLERLQDDARLAPRTEPPADV